MPLSPLITSSHSACLASKLRGAGKHRSKAKRKKEEENSKNNPSSKQQIHQTFLVSDSSADNFPSSNYSMWLR